MSPKTTDDPKEIRLEIKLSVAENEMLEHCAEVFGQPKAAVLRNGLIKMYKQAEVERELRERYVERIDIEFCNQLSSYDSYSVRQVADYCDVTVEEVRKSISEGELEAGWNAQKGRFDIEAEDI